MKIIIFFTCIAAVTLARRDPKNSDISSQKLNPDTNSDSSQDYSSGRSGQLQLGRSLVSTGPGNFVYPLQPSLGKRRQEIFQEDSQNTPQTAKIEKRTGIDDVRDSDETGNFNYTPKSESESRQVVYAGYKPETGFYSVYFPTLNNIPFISGAPLDWNG
ncbi:unnamed protein product [Allacma fusca]|uniref:Uncharacterized protein n=1 Tax=Allacma fusca TaxID=39272 RepID=A0A8J2KMP5_9HEXA|nr:unnamed protein product [Allacma fusca]